ANCIATALTRLSYNVVLHLRHRDKPSWTTILYDAENLKTSSWIAVRPHIHTIDDFACAASALYNRIAALPRLKLSAGAAGASNCDHEKEKNAVDHEFDGTRDVNKPNEKEISD